MNLQFRNLCRIQRKLIILFLFCRTNFDKFSNIFMHRQTQFRFISKLYMPMRDKCIPHFINRTNGYQRVSNALKNSNQNRAKEWETFRQRSTVYGTENQ